MANISMKSMLESGVHFGHQTSKWNPKMGKYIFGERNGIHILDLQKTLRELKKVHVFLKEQGKLGKKCMFVGTKKQAQEVVKAEATRSNMPYVCEKWLGGILTNFQTVKKSVERLKELEKWQEEGLFKAISKKEASRLNKEHARLSKLLSGVRDMKSLPDLIFIVDLVDNDGALKEAKILGKPVISVCDTNCNPELVDHPIPGNDDAARAVKFFCTFVADSLLEGKAEATKESEQEAQAKEEENNAIADAMQASAKEEKVEAEKEGA
ncbi:MAG: 30S ribosomal protein S2 [Elusimicrobiaceae bacterium]|nr:30S ribosomal protein S2 [Elusimicrobiaceae bacterium]